MANRNSQLDREISAAIEGLVLPPDLPDIMNLPPNWGGDPNQRVPTAAEISADNLRRERERQQQARIRKEEEKQRIAAEKRREREAIERFNKWKSSPEGKARIARSRAEEKYQKFLEGHEGKDPRGSIEVIDHNRRFASGEHHGRGLIPRNYRRREDGVWVRSGGSGPDLIYSDTERSWNNLHPDTPESEKIRIKNAMERGEDPFPDYLLPDEQGSQRPWLREYYRQRDAAKASKSEQDKERSAFNRYIRSVEGGMSPFRGHGEYLPDY